MTATAKKVTLGEVCEFIRGLTYAKGDESQEPTGNIVLRANNIDQETSRLLLSDLKYLKANLSPSEDKRLKKNDVFICTSSGSRAHVGKLAFLEEDLPYFFGGFMGVIRCTSEKILPKFLFMILKGENFKRYILSIIAGANINNLRGDSVLAYKIILPDIATQRAATEKFDLINSVQQMHIEVQKLLSDFAPALFDQMFGGLAGQSFLKKKLQDVVTVRGGGTPSKQNGKFWGGTIPWVSPKDMGSETIEDTEDHITDNAITESATNLIPANSLLVVTRSGILKHTVPIAITAKPMTINQDIKALIPSDEINPIFLFWQLRGLARHLLTLIKTGATVQSLNTDALTGLDILVPPRDKQDEFADLVEDSTKIRAKQLRRGQLIDEVFSALTAQLL